MRHLPDWKALEEEGRRRRVLVVLIVFFAGLLVSVYWAGIVSLRGLALSVIAAAVISARPAYYFGPDMGEWRDWEIESLAGAIRFHVRGSQRTIEGRQITQLKFMRRSGVVKRIDISYDNQTTRIRYYQNMPAIYVHLLSIVSGSARVVEE